MTRMYATIAALLLCVTPAEYAAAEADRAQYGINSGYVYYLSTSHLEGEHAGKCQQALAYVVASSSRQQLIERCTPTPVQAGLSRIDLRDLQWKFEHFRDLFKAYPYSRAPGHNPPLVPVVIRADWLLLQLADATESQAYYQLLYGTDKLTRDDFLKAWKVNNAHEDHFAIISAGNDPLSPVVAKQRDVERRPTAQGYSAWGTLDSAEITKDRDPVEAENLNGGYKHDAEEWIVMMPKVSLATGDRGALFAYFLSNGVGQRQEEAPPNIATDHLRFRGQAAIRNGAGGSCIGCHAQGYLDPGISKFRSYVTGNKAGVEIYQKREVQEAIDLYRASKAAKQIARDNEDFAAGLKLCNGLTGDENADAFRGCIAAYDGDVSLETAAAEFHVEPRELSLAIGYYSEKGGKVSVKLAGLADSLPMERSRWEGQDGWYTAYLALELWGKSK